MAKKKPFQDKAGKWYHVIGAKKPRPFSEKVLKKAVKAIKKAKRAKKEAHAKTLPLGGATVNTPDFVEKLAEDLATEKLLPEKVRVRKV